MAKARKTVHAVVLGGGRFKGIRGMKAKGAILIAGKPISSRALTACRNSGVVDQLVFVGPEEIRLAAGEKRVAPSAERRAAFESAKRGLLALTHNKSIVVLPGDMPFITAKAVREIVGAAERENADIYIPLIDAKEYEKSRFGRRKRTATEFSEGSFISSGIVVVSPSVLKNQKLIGEASKVASYLKDRKVARAVYALGRKFGFLNILKMAKTRLPKNIGKLVKPPSLQDLQKVVSRATNSRVVVGLHNLPELGFDVDKPGHIELAERIVKK